MATKTAKQPRTAPRKRRKASPTTKPKRNPWTRKGGEIYREGMRLGYARVSTLDQNLSLQRDALAEAGCEKVFIEQMSGAVTDRPALREALDYARSGDTLIVWKLDRLARSMKQLIETVEQLRLRNIGFRSLTGLSTRRPRRASWCFICSAHLRNLSARLSASAPERDLPPRGASAAQGDARRNSPTTTLTRRGRCSPIPISGLPTLPTGLVCRPRRSIATCPPRGWRIAQQYPSSAASRLLHEKWSVDPKGLFWCKR